MWEIFLEIIRIIDIFKDKMDKNFKISKIYWLEDDWFVENVEFLEMYLLFIVIFLNLI